MAPAPMSEFVALVLEALAPLGPVAARRMFGGYGITCAGLAFALVADDVLYLKADEVNRPDFLARGLAPFKPFADKPMVMSYYPLPEEALDEPEAIRGWGESGLGAARRAEAAKAARAAARAVRPKRSRKAGTRPMVRS
jgi:DNA transformation protein